MAERHTSNGEHLPRVKRKQVIASNPFRDDMADIADSKRYVKYKMYCEYFSHREMYYTNSYL